MKIFKSNKFLSLILFLFLFHFSLSATVKEVSYTDFLNGISESQINKEITYKISYIRYQITQSYIRIIVNPTTTVNNLYLYFSHISEKREDVSLLNSLKDNEIVLYINKEFTKSEADGEFYLTLSSDSTNYDIEISVLELDQIDLSRDDTYSYYVTDKKNTQTIFKVLKEDESENYLTFWAVGSENIEMNVKYVDSDEKETEIAVFSYQNGKISYVKESDYPSNKNNKKVKSSLCYFIIEVNTDANNLITIGSKVISQNLKKYKVNSKEIQGILSKNYLEYECYDFELTQTSNIKYYLNVIDFKKSINIKLKNIQSQEWGQSFDIPDGMTTIDISSTDYANNYFCFVKNNDDVSEAPYSFQLTDSNNNKNSPQINGYSYVRYLQSGQSAFYTGLPKLNFKTEYRYNLKILSGFPKMEFKKKNIYENSNTNSGTDFTPHQINDFYSYSIYKTEISPIISNSQYVLYVTCEGNSECIFETNFYSELDKVILRKNNQTFQNIMLEGKTTYSINLNNDKNFQQIFVDVMTYTGDLNVNFLIDDNEFKVENYRANNKQFFVIEKSKSIITSNEILFTVEANLASHYSVEYKLISTDSDKSENILNSGAGYIETISTNSKIIKLKNLFYSENKNFMANFYPLNCEISIKRIYDTKQIDLVKNNNLYQDIFIRSDSQTEYDLGVYSYLVTVNKKKSINDLCMVYLTSSRLNNDADTNYKIKQLSVAEGEINQVILSQNFNKIQYIYPHINPEGFVGINFNLQTESLIDVKISIENELYNEYSLGKSTSITITENELRYEKYCPKDDTRPNQLCNIIIEITLNEKFYSEEPLIEFVIKSKENIPKFLSKSFLRKDIVVGNFNQYYYSEIEKNENGFVNINFDRGFGVAYGRLVSKNENEKKGWSGKYILPDKDNNELKYDSYFKKLYFTKSDTEKCDEGCYLFFKVENNPMGDDYFIQDNITFPISVYINSNNNNNVETVNIPINEYIIGDVTPNDNSDYLNDYYNFIIPYDCEELIFEFLADSNILYINVGDSIPTKKNSKFVFKNLGKDTVNKITKSEILNTLNINEDTIKNISLIIGVDSQFYNSLYAFRVRAVKSNEINLISLNSDKKTLCEVTNDSKYCYFLISYNDKLDEMNNLLFYAIEEPNTQFEYYADLVDKSIILNRNKDEIQKILPNENSQWTSLNSKGNYLFINSKDLISKSKNKYLLLTVELVKNTKSENVVINLLHNFYNYKGVIFDNTVTQQLFYMKDENDLKINFDYIKDNKNFLVHINKVFGNGKTYWDDSINMDEKTNDEKEIYYITNKDKNLDLSVGKSEIIPLRIQNNEDSGFGFYISYEPLSNVQNFNELTYNKYENKIYKDVDFPMVFYTKIPDNEHFINFYIKISSLSNSNNNVDEETQLISYDKLFNISGIVTIEDVIYQKKGNSSFIPSEFQEKKIEGTYDALNGFVRILFTKEILQKFNIDGQRYLYIVVDKTENNDYFYQKVKLESFVIPSNNDGYYAPLNVYYPSKLPLNYEGYLRYELSRVKNIYRYMRIEFSSNTDKLNYAIININNNEKNDVDFYKNSTNFLVQEVNGGKSNLIIDFGENNNCLGVYLTVFNTENDKHINRQEVLSNFIFRYQLSENKDFVIPKLEKSEINYSQNNGIVKLEIPKIIEDNGKYEKIKFRISILPQSKIENYEKFEDISLFESQVEKIYYKEIYNFDDDYIIELKDINFDKLYYAVVQAQLTNEKDEEFINYKKINNPTNYEESSSTTYVYIIISLLLLLAIIAIGFIIGFLCLKKSNLRKTIQLKSLSEQLQSERESQVYNNNSNLIK